MAAAVALPTAPPAPAPAAGEPAGLPPTPDVAAPGEQPTLAPPEPVAALPAFEIEPPYPPGARPRPAGLVAASAEDELVARWNIGGNADPEHASRRAGFHPAVRVVVDTRPLGRLPRRSTRASVLTDARLLALARRNGYWPIRSCYEAALRRAPKDAGATRIRVSIAASGRVVAARLLSTRLTDRDGVSCLVRALRSLRFAPAPPRRLDADVSIELWPGDAPLPPVAPGEPTPTLDAAAVRARLGEHAAALGRCYLAGVERDRELWGRIALRVEVDADGRVRAVLEDESRFPDAEVVRCLVSAVQAIELPGANQPYAFILALRCGLPPEPAEPAPLAGER